MRCLIRCALPIVLLAAPVLGQDKIGILELTGTRLPASAVMAVLESPAVLRAFDLAEADLETIQHWLHETAIRWGIDAAHR